MKKVTKKESIGIEKSSIILNLKGKKVSLSMEELRQLQGKLNSFFLSSPYSISYPYVGPYFGGNTVGVTTTAATNLTALADSASTNITIGEENE